MSALDKPLKTTTGLTFVPQVFDASLNDWVPTTGTNGVPDVYVTNLHAIQDVTLQNAATATGNGTSFTPTNGNATLTFVVRGTSTSRTVNFELADPTTGVFVAQTAYRVDDASVSAKQTSNGTDAAPESWQVEVPAGWAFHAKVTAIAGGNVTVAGKAVV